MNLLSSSAQFESGVGYLQNRGVKMIIYKDLNNIIKDGELRDAIRQRINSAQLLNKIDYSVDKMALDLDSTVFDILVISSGYYTDNTVYLIERIIGWLSNNDVILKKYVDLDFYNDIS